MRPRGGQAEQDRQAGVCLRCCHVCFSKWEFLLRPSFPLAAGCCGVVTGLDAFSPPSEGLARTLQRGNRSLVLSSEDVYISLSPSVSLLCSACKGAKGRGRSSTLIPLRSSQEYQSLPGDEVICECVCVCACASITPVRYSASGVRAPVEASEIRPIHQGVECL